MALVPGAALEETTHTVAVAVENMPGGFALQEIKPPAVAVTVAGSRRALLLARTEDFRLVIDADLVKDRGADLSKNADLSKFIL